MTNLAAKVLAVNPKLSPPQVVALIREHAERTADGRRVLIDAARTLAAAEARRGR